MRITLLLGLLSGFLLTLPSSAWAQEDASPARPSFLFFLVDDLGWTDLGVQGSRFYETPNVDGLAAAGVRFTQAYAACPVCSPTRASILTGKYPARLDTTDYFGAPGPDAKRWQSHPLKPAPYVDRLPLEEVTLAEALQEAGYRTFFAGKWHLGPEGWFPEDQGFDVNRGGIQRGGPYGGGKYFSPYGNERLEDGPDGEHLPDRLARETVRFLQDCGREPFLAYLSFYSVHTPLMARPDLQEKYEAKAAALAPVEPRWLPEGERKCRQVQDHAVYAGMVEAMDQAVGTVLRGLEECGARDRTYVFFFSDNGGLSTSEGHPTSNLPLRAGKGWLYEGGIREPCIMAGPGLPAGAVRDVPVISTDFYPTILELAGLPPRPEQHVDGVSILPALTGGSLAGRDLFWHYPHYGNQGGSPGAAIRRGDWKLVEFFGSDRRELYHLGRDPGEQVDLAAAQPERVQELARALHQWQQDVDAKRPTEH